MYGQRTVIRATKAWKVNSLKNVSIICVTTLPSWFRQQTKFICILGENRSNNTIAKFPVKLFSEDETVNSFPCSDSQHISWQCGVFGHTHDYSARWSRLEFQLLLSKHNTPFPEISRLCTNCSFRAWMRLCWEPEPSHKSSLLPFILFFFLFQRGKRSFSHRASDCKTILCLSALQLLNHFPSVLHWCLSQDALKWKLYKTRVFPSFFKTGTG